MHVKNSKGGYGVVYQEIMSSDKLHRDSKVIYAYLCSYADKDGVCYPTRARIKAALQMNDKTFKRYMDPLIDLGVVEVERTTNPRGLLGRNIYHLTHNICQDTAHRDASQKDASQQDASQQVASRRVASYQDTSQSRCISEGSININNYNSNILNNININSNTINNTLDGTPKKDAKSHTRKSDPIKYSDDPELEEAIHEFIKFRKDIKKPMSDMAIKLMMNKLEKLSQDKHEQVQILNQSIMQGWTGIYELKDDRKNGSRGQAKSRSASYQGGFDDDFKQYLTDK